MGRPRIGLLSVHFDLFDKQMRDGFREAQQRVAEGYAELLAARLDVEVVYPGLLASDADGDRANELLRGSLPDALVFAPAMAAPPSYAIRAMDGIDAPIVVWSSPAVERLPADLTQAGATEHTTQVGCVMVANVLVRQARPFTAVTAASSDAGAVDVLVRTIRAAMAAGRLRGATALRVGDPIPGYLDVEASAEALAQLGVTERAVSVAELDAAFEEADDNAARLLLADLDTRGWEREPAETDERSARLALALARLVADHGAGCGTVNCHGPWLRWNERIGITACLGVSLLTGQSVPFSCTGDQPAALALLLARAVSGRALYSEFYAPELDTGLMLLAAGGEGDPAWADPSTGVRREPNGHYPGVNGPGTGISFKLEPGAATVLSLSPGFRGWRLAWATGEIVETRYPRMGGPNAMFRFDSGGSREASARWIESGATHHNALAAGRLDVEVPALCRALSVEAVRV